MQEVHKLAKNHQWFRTIMQKAPINYKTQTRNTEMDENKLTFKQFSNILDFIAQQAEITLPTKEQKHQLFEEFNDGKNQDYFVKEQYQKFVDRMFEMLAATLNG